MFGRYEFHDDNAGKRGSHKYWEVIEYTDGMFACFWGRIGAVPQAKFGMNSGDVAKKVSEKIGKGYQHTGDAFSCEQYKQSVVDISAAKKLTKKKEKKPSFDFMAELRKL